MHEKAPVLQANKRERIGTRYAQRDRAQGRLPAVVFGHNKPSLPITLDRKQAMTLIQKGEKVFRLDFPGHQEADEMQMVLLKALQFDYLGTNVVHADMARVDLNERVHTRVHIQLVGEPIGLKQAGAILMHPLNEIEIECRVVDIPESIEVSITDLDLGQMITAGQVKLPLADMRLVSDPHGVVAQCMLGGVTKTAEEEAAEAAPTEPEVITAKKPEEGAAAPAAGAKGAAAPAKGAAAPAKGAAPAAGAKPAGGEKKK